MIRFQDDDEEAAGEEAKRSSRPQFRLGGSG